MKKAGEDENLPLLNIKMYEALIDTRRFVERR
jgi:hypothetical protein